MKVHQLITRLMRYNPEAEVNVVVDGRPTEFDFSYGTTEGCTPQTCDAVYLNVDTEEEN